MLGAIAGDVIGSIFEGSGEKTKEFPLFGIHNIFTDDTVLTVAVADHLLHGGDLIGLFHDYYARYPHRGFGGRFHTWAGERQREPYGSWGNGSAMRVSPVAYAYTTLEDVLLHAARTAAVTHDHPEGVQGAQAVATAIFLARTGVDRTDIRTELQRMFDYDLSASLDDIRPAYQFEVSCRKSVPESLIAFFEAVDFEDAVRNAISLGGDADTMACIAGAVAEAYWGAPDDIARETRARLDLPLNRVLDDFQDRFSDRFRRRTSANPSSTRLTHE